MRTISRIRRLHDAGVSVWLDDLSRPLLEDGVLARYIADHAVSGVTSNPTIFRAALRATDYYDAQIEELIAAGVTEAEALFFRLALHDVAEAARLLRDTYERSHGRDGYVSFECTPDVARDTHATIRQARRVWQWLDQPNVMIKVPATDEGIASVEELTAAGVNVNVTLVFNPARHEQAARAYTRGIERRIARGEPVDGIRSVASVFVSRLDGLVDDRFGRQATGGSAAVANARAIHEQALAYFDGARWQALASAGAHRQRPLWASMAPKSDRMSDVAYVEELALPETIVTLPERTLLAFADHGEPQLAALERPRIHVDAEALGAELETAGMRAFADAYAEILDRLREHVAHATTEARV